MTGQEWNTLLPMLLAVNAGKNKQPNKATAGPLAELLSLLPAQTGGAGILQTLLSLLPGKGEAEQGSGGLSALLPLLDALQPQLGAQKESAPAAGEQPEELATPARTKENAAATPVQERNLQTSVSEAFTHIKHFAGEEIVQRLEAYFTE